MMLGVLLEAQLVNSIDCTALEQQLVEERIFWKEFQFLISNERWGRNKWCVGKIRIYSKRFGLEKPINGEHKIECILNDLDQVFQTIKRPRRNETKNKCPSMSLNKML